MCYYTQSIDDPVVLIAKVASQYFPIPTELILNCCKIYNFSFAVHNGHYKLDYLVFVSWFLCCKTKSQPCLVCAEKVYLYKEKILSSGNKEKEEDNREQMRNPLMCFCWALLNVGSDLLTGDHLAVTCQVASECQWSAPGDTPHPVSASCVTKDG